MRLRNLAALAALHVALAACAETPRTVGHFEAAAQAPTLPPIGKLCDTWFGDCLSYYHLFSSEAFGTGGLTEHLLELKRRAGDYETMESQGFHLLGTPARVFAEMKRDERETIQKFVAQWLAAYASDGEAYLAMAAVALEHALDEYCTEFPFLAIIQRKRELGLKVESQWIEGYMERLGGSEGLVAPGYENAGESLLQYAPCDGGQL